MASEVTCPTCGTVSHFEEVGRDATAFCRVCDYPLFWLRTGRSTAANGDGGDVGLRRLPGTAGRVALATFPCPVCTEPNEITAALCIRCGADLHPAPVTEVVAPPSPPPAPVVRKRAWWPFVLAVLGLVAIALIVAFSVG